jgi:hypothetical protein
METPLDSQQNFNSSRPVTLPNSTAVLVLGILSIVFCWCFGIVGLTLGIIALVLSKNASETYLENPDRFTETSYKNMNAGKICAIVGTSLSGLYIVTIIIRIAFFGALLGGVFSSFPWHGLK